MLLCNLKLLVNYYEKNNLVKMTGFYDTYTTSFGIFWWETGKSHFSIKKPELDEMK